MAWTYDPAQLNDPIDGPLMQLRLIIHDTDESNQLLQDEELQFFLANESTLYMAAAHVCQALSGKFSRLADKQVGDLKISYQKVSDRYLALSTEYENKGRPYQIPSAGGVFKADRDSNQADESVLHTYIRRGMHDFSAPPVVPNSQS